MALVQHANQYALIHQACINHAIISNKELVVDGAEYTASPSKPVSIFIHAWYMLLIVDINFLLFFQAFACYFFAHERIYLLL